MKRILLSLMAILAIVPMIKADSPMGVFSTINALTEQKFIRCEGALDTSLIDAELSRGRFVSSAVWADGSWLIVTSRCPLWKKQRYTVACDWPLDWQTEQLDAGYMITTMASDGNNMLIVATLGVPSAYQTVIQAPVSTIKEDIYKMLNLDYSITTATFHRGQWAVVASYTRVYDNQTFFSAVDFDELQQMIAQKLKRNEAYYITTLAQDETGRFFVIMSVNHDRKPVRQKLIPNPSAPTVGGNGYPLTVIG